MAVPAYPDDAEAETPGFERCTISRWRGYVTSTFVAVLEDGTPIAESSAFRARGQQIPPDAEAARAAFAELRAELERQEWDAAAGEFDPWYEAVFTRPVEAPEPAVQTVEAPPRAPQLAPPPPPAAPRPAQPRPAPPRPTPPRPAPPRHDPPRIQPPVVAEPRPEPELPPVAPAAGGSSRPSRMIVVVSTLGIAAALALGAYLELGSSGRHAARRPATPVSAPAAKPRPKPISKPRQPASRAPLPTPKPKPATVRIDISAPTRASWLEIRRGGPTGPVLFSGELAPGQNLHLRGTRLWARFGGASNLTIRANGRLLRFTGTYEHVFAAAKK